jgi:hypothetical protein
MLPENLERVYTTFARYFNINRQVFSQAGTTLYPDPHLQNFFTFYSIEQRVIVHLPDVYQHKVAAYLSQKPNNYRLTAAETATLWEDVEHYTELVYFLEPRDFHTIQSLSYQIEVITDKIQPRNLHHFIQNNDEPLLQDDVFMGAFHSDYLVAVASTGNWHGFRDVRVAVDPAHQAAGTALVSALCHHHLIEDPGAIFLYRHDQQIKIAQHIAQEVGFQLYTKLKEFTIR